MKTVTTVLLIVIFATACKKNDSGVTSENPKQVTIDSMNTVISNQKIEIAKQKSIDSMKVIMAQQKESNHQMMSNATQSSNTTTTTTTTKRKKWSNTAKGAVIGAGVGAISGAIIDKKHGEGAIIGGLSGAALGAGTGAILDSKKK